jgi:HEAT repeat protein
MSQDPTAKPTVTPADALAAIGRGDPKPSELAGLSDLSRADAKQLRVAWSGFPEPLRISVLRQLEELAETDVQYQFGRVFRIALEDSSAVARQLAISALWEDSGSDLIDAFLDRLESDPSTDVRGEAAAALSRFAEAAALDELDASDSERIEAVLFTVAEDESADPLVRRKALEAAAIFGDSERLRALIVEAYESDDVPTQASAVYAMGRSLDRKWLPTVISEYESEDPELRYEAARASGELGHVDAVPGLSNLALDRDAEVRGAAIAALGKIGGPGATRVLGALGNNAAAAADREAIDDALTEAQMMADPARIQP